MIFEPTETLNKPVWLKQKGQDPQVFSAMESLIRDLSLHTVCESANCPNMGVCFKNHTATFMVMGNVCTRNCRYCAVDHGVVSPLDEGEPKRVALACQQLGLKHVVITSVTRDDLADGGAGHFAETVKQVRQFNKNITVELLIPDLLGNWDSLRKIVITEPDVLNHNVETVPTLYGQVRPQAQYARSLKLLEKVKEFCSDIYTKSGLMVGLGETKGQVVEVMKDLQTVGCDILTIGQYLAPSADHVPVAEYISPEQFENYRITALDLGFKSVLSGPFVRSSYEALKSLERFSVNKSC